MSFLTNDKYEGYWDNDCLYLNQIVLFPNKITPDIKIELFEKENVRIVNVECDLKRRFKISSVIFFIILGVFEALICVTLIRQKDFNIVCISPLIIGVFGYFILRFSFSWEATNIKYELMKLLK
ncbi:MAG: hypothetical protein HXX18_02250 [Bacteroidetes bacterium]|nr:hypothetical protein [Bacteroidota bacterium]